MDIKELALRAKNNDSAAWSQLFSMTKDMVYFTSLKLCHNKQNAEDIVQETYIKAMENISRLQAPEAFVTWLRTIAVNITRNHLAKNSPAIFGTDESDELLKNIPEVEEDFLPAEYASKRETARIIMRIIDTLPEKQRVTVMLYYYNEVPVAKIAEMLNVSENTVKSRLNYARAEIKRQVEELEKQGTKLHGIAVPFLSLAIKEAAKDYFLAEAAAAKTLAAISAVSAAGAVTATTAATATATTAATGGLLTKLASLPIAAKIIAGMLGAAIVAGTVAGVSNIANGSGEKDRESGKKHSSIITDIGEGSHTEYSSADGYTNTPEEETSAPKPETSAPEQTTEATAIVPTPGERTLLCKFIQNELIAGVSSKSYLPYLELYSDGSFEGLANIYYATVKVEGTWTANGDGNYTMSVSSPRRTYEFNVSEFNLYFENGTDYAVITFNGNDSMGMTENGAKFELESEVTPPNANTPEGAREILEEFRLSNRTNSDGSISYAYADVTHDGIDELIVMNNTSDYFDPEGAYYEVFTVKNEIPTLIFKNGTGFTTNSMYEHYLYTENGKAYLLSYGYFARQGSPLCLYEIFSLDENGSRQMLRQREEFADYGEDDSNVTAVSDEAYNYINASKLLITPTPDDYSGFCATTGWWYHE